jgi:GNAT superfamily N-acetyltransferase
MQLYLRDALPSDVDDLIALMLGGRLGGDYDGPHHTSAYLDALREIDESDDSYLLVAELGGHVVAMLQLFTFRHFQHRGGRCAEIESMRVADDVRGRGIGTRLLTHAVTRAEELGCYRIQLTSNEARADAHRFYEAHDFVGSHRGFKRYLR